MSCCCTCFSFLKCCDCCGGSCDGRKDKPHKHLDDPYPPAQPFRNQGYQAPAPMMGGGLGSKPEPPQYAQFEVGKSGLAVTPALSEDALPPMPSWDSAAKKHVMTEEEKNAVELGELDPATGQKVPLMAGAVSPAIGGPPSPAHDPSPYGSRPGQGVGGNGYMGGGDPYGPPRPFNNGYRGPGSPGPGYRGPGSPGPGGFRNGPSPAPGRRGMGPGGRGYGPPSMAMDGASRGFPQSPEDQYANDGFGGPGAGFGRAQPQRQGSNDTYGSRPYPQQRQYTDDSSRPMNAGRQYSDRPSPSDNFQRGPSRGPGGPPNRGMPPPQNNGFDEQPYPSDNFQPPRGPSRGPGPNRMGPPQRNNSNFDDLPITQPYTADAFQSRGPSQGPPIGPPPQQNFVAELPSDNFQPSRRSPPQHSNTDFQEQPYHSNDFNSTTNRMASPPLENNAGFDFSGGAGRPQQVSYGSPAPTYATRDPAPEEGSYSGYKPYQGNGSRAPTAPRPGQGRREQPQNWDPVQS